MKRRKKREKFLIKQKRRQKQSIRLEERGRQTAHVRKEVANAARHVYGPIKGKRMSKTVGLKCMTAHARKKVLKNLDFLGKACRPEMKDLGCQILSQFTERKFIH